MPATRDDLRCLWRNCPSSGSYADCKALYDHIVCTHCKDPVLPFVCQWEGCTASLPTPGKVTRTRHMISHTAYRPYVCTQPGCTGKAYSRRTGLVHHHLSKHHDVGTDGSSDESGSSSSSESDEDEGSESPASRNKPDDDSLSELSGSESQASEDEEEDTARVECLWADCDAAPFSADYAGAAELSEHLSSHFTAKKCMWGACRQSLRRGAYKSHLLTHLPEWYRPYECDMCQRSFGRSSALKHHQTATHPSPLGKRDREESIHDESPRKKHRSLRSTRIDSSSARGSTIAVDELQPDPTSNVDEGHATTCASDQPAIMFDKSVERPSTGESENGLSKTCERLEQRLESAEAKILQLELQVRELLRDKAAALAETPGTDQLLDPALFAYDN